MMSLTAKGRMQSRLRLRGKPLEATPIPDCFGTTQNRLQLLLLAQESDNVVGELIRHSSIERCTIGSWIVCRGGERRTTFACYW